MNVKQLLISLFLICSVSLTANNIIYVSTSGTTSGSGSDWSTATSLVNACNTATAGDEIWVAQGTYLPGDSRTSSFNIPAGVRVYGGFSGQETTLDQRQPASYITTLSGNIGDRNDQEDNVYTVVTMNNAGGKTVLDGFVLTGGKATEFIHDFTMATTGGALYISGGNNGQGPLIKNCTFTGNMANNGGAVFINGSNGYVKPQFVSCTFNDNKAVLKGGAIFNDATNGKVEAIFENCSFNHNGATNGGCILNNGDNGESKPLVINSEFTGNTAASAGSVIYNLVKNGGTANQTMNNCKLEDNVSHLGGAIGSNSNIQQSASSSPNNNGGTLRPVN
ncbi:hypothetical protein CEQ90_07670 [Lewinellaceae bacterium SD302]|nr:hypothetical protein CEQ90_07670 [Lewinellaceae bacterium SD302]